MNKSANLTTCSLRPHASVEGWYLTSMFLVSLLPILFLGVLGEPTSSARHMASRSQTKNASVCKKITLHQSLSFCSSLFVCDVTHAQNVRFLCRRSTWTMIGKSLSCNWRRNVPTFSVASRKLPSASFEHTPQRSLPRFYCIFSEKNITDNNQRLVFGRSCI